MSSISTVLFISLIMVAAISILTAGREKYIVKPPAKKLEQESHSIAPVQLMSDYLGLKPSAVMATRKRRSMKHKRILLLPHFH